MRVLMLASYFPKPGRDTIGPWALDQAHSLVTFGTDLQVVSLTPWLPRGVFRSEGGRAIADCPSKFNWGEVKTLYPRWPYYHMNPVRRWSYPNPTPFLKAAFRVAEPNLLKVVDDFEPDIIFAHHSAVNGFVAARLKETTGVQFVVTDHSFEEIEDCRRFPGRLATYQYVAEHAATMVSVCSRMERLVKSLLPNAQTRTIYNGFPEFPERLLDNPRPAELKKNLIIFSAGAFYTRKSFPFLIDVFADVSRSVPNAVLRIAGDGADMAAVRDRINQHGLHESVQLLGLRSRAEVLQEIAWADVFGLLGRDEPFAHVFLEAMSAGKPIVCCNDSGINDVITNRIDALTVPPGDKERAVESFCSILQDQSLRSRIGDSGRHLFTQRLRGEANAAACVSLFQEIIDKSHTR